MKALKIITVIILLSIFLFGIFQNVIAESFKQRVQDEIQKAYEREKELKQENTKNNHVIDKIKKEAASSERLYDKNGKPLTLKDEVIGTIRATGIRYLPLLTLIVIGFYLAGSLWATFKFLVKTSIFLGAGAVIGYVLMFTAEYIADFIVNTIQNLKITV